MITFRPTSLAVTPDSTTGLFLFRKQIPITKCGGI